MRGKMDRWPLFVLGIAQFFLYGILIWQTLAGHTCMDAACAAADFYNNLIDNFLDNKAKRC